MGPPAVPALRDVLTAVWELAYHLVAFVVRHDASSPSLSRTLFFGLAITAALAVATARYFVLAALLVGLVPGTIVFLHARDITRMRWLLAQIARSAVVLPPKLAPEELLRSPAVAALHAVAHAVHAARRGDVLEVERRASEVDPASLDAATVRLLTLARANAALGAGEQKRAATLAADVLPTGDAATDRELALCMLRQAWRDKPRLRGILRTWSSLERPGPLRDLGLLAALHVAKKREWDALLAGVDRHRIDELAAQARALGDQELAQRLSNRRVPDAPYR